jgi:hypothetical protein
MADYGNIFSPDYWTPEGQQWRQRARHDSSHELAIKQDESNRAPWEAAGKGISDFFGGLIKPFTDSGAADRVGGAVANSGGMSGAPFNPTVQRSSTFDPTSLLMPNQVEDSGNILDALHGKYNTPEAQTPYNNSVEAPMDSGPTGMDATEILKRLGEKFSFDPNSVDSAPLDAVLQNNLKALNGVRDTTNQNFKQSDANVANMYGAHEQDVKNQTDDIAARGAANEKAVGGIFDKTIADNNAELAANRRTEEEMLKRLGIAPAAAQPDLVGQAITEGNNAARQSKDTRVAEAKTNTQTDISRNNTLASAVGNDGLQRRSDLNMRLQEILGGLGQKETDFNNQYQQNKLDLMQKAEDKSYDRWLQDRQFDMGLFNSVNQANSAGQDKELDRQNRLDVANIQAGSRANQGSGSSQGWLGSKSPGFQNAFFDVAQKVDIAHEPQKAIQMLADPKYGLSPSEVVTAITDYANLGRVNASNFTQ